MVWPMKWKMARCAGRRRMVACRMRWRGAAVRLGLSMAPAPPLNFSTLRAIGKRIREDSAGKHKEKSAAADAGEFMEDGRCGGTNEETLIDAQKPERRKE